ncbi:hypothetical protein [Robiginitalea marina]|uniref:Uncharacterized protein n=1 Tax=Robiginitalea marina TaxID=2954105 RepID=A0ABT1B0T9_9FLAO|nr:hypothetical protein [Robiginitalea marina]MCO5725579.1 hypothetical protein [Robiginitalea marina]
MVLGISVGVTYFSLAYELGYNVDLTLLSIAIVFPLVFNIRGAFRRREKALEHLSRFRSSLKTLYFYVQMGTELTPEDKAKSEALIGNISDLTLLHLKKNPGEAKAVDDAINELHYFILQSEEGIPRRIRDRMFRYLNDLQEGFENLHAINTHRTPKALKAYCLVFIFVFPLIYAPNIVFNIGVSNSDLVIYFIVVVTEFILISLYNIQDQMEYPFDEVGLDDIQLENFGIDR